MNREPWYEENEMDMPCICQSCNVIFDLNDGTRSDKWYPGTVICEICGDLEEREIELDDEMENEQNNLEDAEWQIKESTKNIAELRKKQEELQSKIEDRRYGTK